MICLVSECSVFLTHFVNDDDDDDDDDDNDNYIIIIICLTATSGDLRERSYLFQRL